MERRKGERYDEKFRRRAVERMNTCDNIVRLSRKLGIQRRLLYKWRDDLEALYSQAESDLSAFNSRESTLRKELNRVKRLLAEKAVELDSFQRRLARSRGSTPEQEHLWREGIYEEIRGAIARQLERRANVSTGTGQPGRILPTPAGPSSDG